MQRFAPRALGALIVPALATLAACGGDEASSGGAVAGAGSPSAARPDDGADDLDIDAAIAVYESAACWTCHGRPHRAEEGLAGPALAGLDEHWTVEDLADFIDDPESWVAKRDRLAVLKSQYPLPMLPTTRPVPLEDRLLLARWLLTLE